MKKILSKQQRRELERENKKWPIALKLVPNHRWELKSFEPNRVEVWRSQEFLVQVFIEKNQTLRMSVSRTEPDANGEWVDGISWDELQRLKREIGRSSFCTTKMKRWEKK